MWSRSVQHGLRRRCAWAVSCPTARAAIDTGYYGISIPVADLDSIFSKLPGQKKVTSSSDQHSFYYRFTCGSAPDLHLVFTADTTSTTYVLSGKTLERTVNGKTYCTTGGLVEGRDDLSKIISK